MSRYGEKINANSSLSLPNQVCWVPSKYYVLGIRVGLRMNSSRELSGLYAIDLHFNLNMQFKIVLSFHSTSVTLLPHVIEI